MADDIVFSASLDDTDVLKALRNIDKNIDKLANSAEKDFQEIGKASSLSGVKIGAVSGVVSSLTTEFINLGKQAIQSLIDISKEAVNVASSYETLQARLLGIFDGSQEAADEAFQFIQAKSKELGIDLSELAGAFLPRVETLDQFERVAKIATALARSDPEQGVVGARIALLEALSGQASSLRRRFEFTREETDKLQNALDTQGIEEFITELEKLLQATGKSFNDLAGTAETTFAKARIQGEQLLGVLGSPILDELKQSFQDIGAIVAERSDDFELIATAIGQLVANVIDFVATNFAEFLQNLDTEQVLGIVDDFQGLVESARNLAEILGLTELPQALLDDVALLADNLNTALITAVQIAALAKAEIARQQAEAVAAFEFGDDPTGAFAGGFGRLTAEQEAEVARRGQEAANAVLRDSLNIIQENKNITDDYRSSLDEFAQSQENVSDATTSAADALLFQANAAKEAERQQAELQDALDKLTKLEEDAAEKRIDILRKAGQKQIDQEEDFYQKRLDTATDFLRKIDDIERKNAQSIEDSGRDLRRDEADALTDYNRERAELERDSAKERIKIEEDFREEIRKINQNFQDNADEAARNRDAATFLRLQRQRERQVEEARTARDQNVRTAGDEAVERREELRRGYEQNLEDARLTDERRLEDLRIRLDREYEEARINNERTLQDLLLNEERKRQELAKSLERQLDEARIANNRRVEDYKESLDAEIAALVEAEQKKTEVLKQQNERRRELDRQRQSTIERFQETGRTSRLGGRQSGGMLGAGQSRVVGERGPEIFTPTVQGTVSPSITNFIRQPNITSSVINNINPTINQSMADQSAITRAIARNEAIATIQGILGNV